MAFIATIPFSGFYESVHSREVDHVLIEMPVEYFESETGEDVPDFIRDDFWGSVEYSAVYEKYAESYAESFLDWLGLDGAFESMDSPKFYNFSTDRVFVTLTRGDVARLWKGVDRAALTDAAKEAFTSRDGFISGYNADWRTWGRLSDWDHNQLGLLVRVYAATEQGSEWDSWSEFELMESDRCNGGIESWAGETSPKWIRYMNVMDYLRIRVNRAIRTMEDWHAARRAENRPFTETPLGSWPLT